MASGLFGAGPGHSIKKRLLKPRKGNVWFTGGFVRLMGRMDDGNLSAIGPRKVAIYQQEKKRRPEGRAWEKKPHDLFAQPDHTSPSCAKSGLALDARRSIANSCGNSWSPRKVAEIPKGIGNTPP